MRLSLNWFTIRFLMIALLLCATHTSGAADREVSRLFKDNCAGCHGDQMQGGQAKTLLDGVWKHGGDDASLENVIRNGVEANGMPPWKGMLNEGEIHSLVVYIREKVTEAKRKQTTYAKPVSDQIVTSEEHKFRARTVVDGLSTPWSVAFLPDGRMLIPELPGNLQIFDKGNLQTPPVQGLPKFRTIGQGGLMEAIPHPGYQTNGWLYLVFSDGATNAAGENVGMTAVVRGRIRDGQWVDEQTIFKAPLSTYRSTAVHFGSRLVFDNSGHIFFGIGERGMGADAQDLTRPNGKIHRLFEDGRIPSDNPFVGRSNAIPSIWCFGNRNPQGLARHPVTGDIWESEHGPRGGDELNWIRKGLNYGWPLITLGMNYDGTPMGKGTSGEGLEQPVTHWTQSIAVCGINFYTGDKFPKWRNNLFVTSLAQEEYRRLVIDDHKIVHQELLFRGIGRIRQTATGPDGYLYIVLNKPDKVVRLEPVE